MADIELLAGLVIAEGGMPSFKERSAMLIREAEDRSHLIRFDWYLNEERATALIVAAGSGDAIPALADRLGRDDGLAACGALSMERLSEGRIAEDQQDALAFAFGLEAHVDIAAGTASGMIEIVTRFAIADAETERFRAIAAELTDLVRRDDPGTLRYDWFFSADGRRCIALDTYAGSAGMFAHMRNAHELHAALVERASLETEFLGELPPDAFAAVAKYDPFVLPRLI